MWRAASRICSEFFFLVHSEIHKHTNAHSIRHFGSREFCLVFIFNSSHFVVCLERCFFLDIWLQAGSKHYVFFVFAHLTRFLFFFMFLVCPRSPPIRFTTIFHHYYHHSFIRWNNRKTTTTTRTSFSIYLNGDLVIITYKYSMEFIQRFW